MPYPPAQFKTCTICKVLKPRAEFSPKSAKKNVVSAQCKPCRADAVRGNKPRYPVDPSVKAKVCNECGVEKDVQFFGRSSNYMDGINPKCKECRNKTTRTVYLRVKYGLTEAEFEAQRLLQHSKCWICLNELEGYGHVDHCHVSGEKRGILCENCNRMLGMARESVITLERAIEYLKIGGVWNTEL